MLRSHLSIVALLGMFNLTGCAHKINPWQDELPPTDSITTASADRARASSAAPSELRRTYEPAEIAAEPGEVTHWPLHWEDPFEDRGSEDQSFKVTWEDYFAFPYGMGRFILNTLAYPLSAVVVPPWTVMVSDGRISRQALGYDHDAERYHGGPPSRIDVLEDSRSNAAIQPGT